MSTTILLKRSLNTAIPASLANGEPAYSANGDVFYIGSNNTVIAIGGKRVPGVLTANQAVVTNSTNMIDKMLFGNSTVNATVNSIAFTLANSTVTFSLTKPSAAQVASGDYFPNSGGGWSQVVGGVTNPGGANTTIQFNDSGSFGGDALFAWDKTAAGLMIGNSSVNTVINAVSVVLNGVQTVNSTGVMAGLLYGNQVNSTANIAFGGANVSMPNANLTVKDLNLSGNLTVLGTVTTIDATNLQVKDSTIKLADQNASDTIDIGFYGMYNDGSNRYRGLLYDASNGNFMLFSNTLAEPTTTLDTSNTSLAVATLRAYVSSGNLVSNSSGVYIGANSTYAVQLVANTLTLSTALAAASGGTGLASFASGDLLVGNSTNGFNKVSVPATDGSMLQWSAGGGVAWSATVDCGTF
jgi:hypothetical protein